MSILEGFVPENSDSGVIFVSITSYGMTFSRASVEAVDYPRFVKVYFDRKGKRFAIVPAEEGDGSRSFAKDRSLPRAGFVRWNDKRLLAQVTALGSLDLGPNGIRVMGEYIPEENLLVYNLKQTIPIRAKTAAGGGEA